jgi:hypothetical protein
MIQTIQQLGERKIMESKEALRYDEAALMHLLQQQQALVRLAS